MSRVSNYIDQYSFYEKIFVCKFLGDSAKIEDKENIKNFSIELTRETLSGYPPIKVKTRSSVDPRNVVFYIYQFGKTYWEEIDTETASKYVIGWFEAKHNVYLSKEKALDLIISTLWRFGEQLQLPEIPQSSYLVNFANKHIFIHEDGTYVIEEPNPLYYFRHAIKIDFIYEEWKDIFPSPFKGKIKTFWDGEESLGNDFFQWLDKMVFKEDYEMIRFVQKIFGVILCTNIGKISGYFYMFYGPRRAFKTSLLKVIEFLAGKGNFSNVSLEQIDDDGMNVEFEHHMVNTFDDSGYITPQKAQNKWTRLKILCGTLARITVNPKYVQPYSIRPIAKHFFAFNFLPAFISSKTPELEAEAFWDRLIIIPCINFLPENVPRDESIIINLINSNKSFIYKFALDGLRRGIIEGWFRPGPKLVQEHLNQYREFIIDGKIEKDNIRKFLDSDKLNLFFRKKGIKRGATITEIYRLFLDWCKELNQVSPTRKFFRKEITTKYFFILVELRRVETRIYYITASLVK